MIKQELSLSVSILTFWTDSTCTLRYTENRNKRFKIFVANRIAAVLEQSSPTQWRYVETALNSAWEASRGMIVQDFIRDARSTNGPEILRRHQEAEKTSRYGQDTTRWPRSEKSAETVANETSNQQDDCLNEVLKRISSCTPIRRIVAWILR